MVFDVPSEVGGGPEWAAQSLVAGFPAVSADSEDTVGGAQQRMEPPRQQRVIVQRRRTRAAGQQTARSGSADRSGPGVKAPHMGKRRLHGREDTVERAERQSLCHRP